MGMCNTGCLHARVRKRFVLFVLVEVLTPFVAYIVTGVSVILLVGGVYLLL